LVPHSLGIEHIQTEDENMTDRSEMFDKLKGLIEPFNKKGVELTDATTFAGDLEWDSLTVMDFVAEVEDTFDIVITMNMQAEIETVGQLVDAVLKLAD
jgi:acyl carrier protein